MGIAFLAISGLVLLRHRYSPAPWISLSALFFAFAFAAPLLLKPVYIFWMRLAFALGWVNTRIILAVMFYLVLTPIGLTMRLFGKDLLDRKIEKAKESYWIARDKKDFSPADYERQF